MIAMMGVGILSWILRVAGRTHEQVRARSRYQFEMVSGIKADEIVSVWFDQKVRTGRT